VGYRDALETRRAQVSQLEERLGELRATETRLRALPRERGLWQTLVGGPAVIEETIDLEQPLDPDALRALCRETFGVDGISADEGGVHVWRGHPEPQPRQVEVRLDEATLTVRDRRSSIRHHASTAAWATVALLSALAPRSSLVLTGFSLLVLLATWVWSRLVLRRVARRRSWEARQFVERAEDLARESRASHPRLRVEALGRDEEGTEELVGETEEELGGVA